MRYLWVLDAGHGGVDANGIYTSCPDYDVTKPETFYKMHVFENGFTVYEGEFNRKVVSKIKEGLDSLGIKNYVLVPGAEDMPLRERVSITDNLHRLHKNCIFLSVHGNAFNGNVRGAEFFTSRGQTLSDKVADVLIDEAEEALDGITPIRTDLSDGDKDKEAGFYVLRKTDCPAVLSENGFFDNEKDAEFMMSEEGINTIAQYHINAIVKIERDGIE